MNGATVGFVLLAATFDDPENARTILLAAAALVLLGVLIAAGTVWWWRSSEVEHPALGPLEVMGSRSWWKGDYAMRRRRLEDARPAGAEPVEPATTSTSEPVDLKAASIASPQVFDDLLEFPSAAATVDVAVDDAVVDAVDDAVGDDSAVERAASVASSEPVVVDGDEPHDDEPHDDEPHDDESSGDESSGDVSDDASAAAILRPIDPLLRLQHDE